MRSRAGGLPSLAPSAALAFAAWLGCARPPAPPPPTFEVPPRLLNPSDVVAALAAAGIRSEARVVLRLLVDSAGAVQQVRVTRSSGAADTDSAAARAGWVMQFEPARQGGRPVRAWIHQPVAFTRALREQPTPAPRRVAASPLDRERVAAQIRGAYPALSGVARIWLQIGGSGEVREVHLAEPAGVELESAAAAVAREIRFEPARRLGYPTESWALYRVAFGTAAGVAPEVADADALDVQALAEAVAFDEGPELADPEGARRLSQSLARRRGPGFVGGTAVLRLFVDAEGVVREASVLESSGSMDVDDLAVELARSVRFEPARRGGRPVPAWVRFPATLVTP